MTEAPRVPSVRPDLRGWEAPWDQIRAVVAGLGLSGFAAADTLAELGASVVVVDAATGEQRQRDAETLGLVGVSDVRLGAEHTESVPEVGGAAPDILVTSPGWRPDSSLIQDAEARGIPVWSEVELAWRLGGRPGARQPQWLTVTGTNGKSTTVRMLEAMLLADGRRAIACGNVGVPVLDAIRDPEGYDVLAVELSSFQLHYTELLDPLASAVLNITSDHVDWHGGMQGYAADKAKIYENTRLACVYNVDEPATEQMVAEAEVQEGCRAVGFTLGTPGPSMLGMAEDLLVDRAYLPQRHRQALELGELADFGPLAPRHVVANTLAAAALARAADVEPAAIREAIRGFSAADHTIQPVAKADDILWINDSKATNPHAAEASLRSFSDVVWIAGGLPKGVEYDELIAQVAPRLRYVILLGTDSSQLRSSLRRHAPDVPVVGGGVREDDSEAAAEQGAADPTAAAALEALLSGTDGAAAMRAAVAEAARVARADETVLMAPAAASMDQFASYRARGEAFIEAVAELMERP
ncbi:UDP-N-acetylmuramoyl-L-alanine--D-glutamate ligase [Nesterenkonia aerolata]|uniref:UDP-N-acetylmuramoylalanine--D-glutamate ligase n=1 Tax=Nesterenkonia aerolata TaxID=3074079 RepID=A0ABU2DQ03_9MICC|nr:UDP-N-acetylmuramoyl-L-alanine--D-glutamate ligase [Nesterenkonia sp. LY-0111]MDR8018476.1 UDP-N-acetylmuramoyl-L-alanine--D-glutamate ligase [Nesterenkonia sp. LY-0111]